MLKVLPVILTALLFFMKDESFAQQNVGIGITTPDPSAILDLTATNKGMLVPRMTTLQRTAIAAPASGLLVYDINFGMFWYFDGLVWNPIQNGLAGPTGPTGDTGVIGPVGPVGPIGPVGPVGAIGPQGPSGLDGAVGPVGPVGAIGPQGPSGLDGAVGPVGPAGAVGPVGPVGAVGPIGPSGLDGAVGPVGPAGAVGPIGPSGLDGAVGPVGPVGPAGAVGPIGPSGLDGAVGPVGPAGAVGPIGPSGLDGAVGPVGPAGAVGPIGPSGLDGAAGAVGPVGPVGPAGAVGPIGPSGLDGAAGAVGPVGPVGPAGAVGLTGPTGPVGCAVANYVIKSNGTDGTCSVIYDNGNVGIGNAAPAQKLDVTGAIQFSGDLRPAGNAGIVGKVLSSNGPGVSPTWVGAVMPDQVFSVESTSSLTATAAFQVIPGETITIPGLAVGDRIMLYASGNALMSTSDYCTMDVAMFQNGTMIQIGGYARFSLDYSGTNYMAWQNYTSIARYTITVAGANTFDVRAQRSAGSGTILIGGNSTEAMEGVFIIFVLKN